MCVFDRDMPAVPLTTLLRLLAADSLAAAGEWPCTENISIEPLSSVVSNCLSFTSLNYSIEGNALFVTNNLSIPVWLRDIRSTLFRLTGVNYSAPEEALVEANSTLRLNISLVAQMDIPGGPPVQPVQIISPSTNGAPRLSEPPIELKAANNSEAPTDNQAEVPDESAQVEETQAQPVPAQKG